MRFFPEGVYSYDAKGQKLVRVTEGDHRNLAGAQPFVFTAPLNLGLCGRHVGYEGKNIPAGMSATFAGRMLQAMPRNVQPLRRRPWPEVDHARQRPEAELLEALGLDPGRYFLALAQTVGK